MKTSIRQVLGIFLLLVTFRASATTRYVDLNSTNATPSFTDWSTAATNIQDAIDAAVAGDLVLVTNGVYATGGRVVYGFMTNRVVINKAVTVQSVNGAAVTVIQGNQPTGNNAVRCVYLTNNATLIGFTLTNGATRSTGDLANEQSGGGAWCFSTSGKLINCLVVSNSSVRNGGGVYHSTLNNCLLMGNSSDFGYGGGASGSLLTNCTLIGNSAQNGGGGASNGGGLVNCTVVGNAAFLGGGGAWESQAWNCIIYYNTAPNFFFGSGPMINCCTTPMPPGTGNFTNAPIFVDLASSDCHLQSNSPCINAGNNPTSPPAPTSTATHASLAARWTSARMSINLRRPFSPTPGRSSTVCPRTARRISPTPTATA